MNDTKIAYFVSLSTMIIIKSYITLVDGSSDGGNFTMKSIVTDFHGMFGISIC